MSADPHSDEMEFLADLPLREGEKIDSLANSILRSPEGYICLLLSTDFGRNMMLRIYPSGRLSILVDRTQ